MDTSKHVSDAAALLEYQGHDTNVRLLHFVRDSRAVVHSAAKRPYSGRPTRSGARVAARVSAGWLRVNLAASLLSRNWPEGRSMVMRYEEFAASPQSAIDQIYTWATGDLNPPAVVSDDGTLVFAANHSVSGGHARSGTENVQIRPDTKWLTGLSKSERLATTVLTAPALLAYGYPLRP